MSASTFSGAVERDFMVPGVPFGSGMPTATAGDAMAPLIFNAWYVVAEFKDVGRSLGRIKAWGQPLVYYRTENGVPAGLDDRCAHRRFPLSKGQLIGDRIQCGYHGFTCESSGQPSNYLVMIENLLDRSHLAFLHKAVDQQHVAVIPSEDSAPPMASPGGRSSKSTEVALAAVLCGGDPKRLTRQEDNVLQCGPALTYGYQRRTPLPGDPEPVRPAVIQVVHAITPEDERRTHQFFTIAASDPFVIEDSEVRKIIQDVIFEQDVDVVGEIQRHIDQEMRPGRIEFSTAYDVFGLKMRRILQTMKETELAVDR